MIALKPLPPITFPRPGDMVRSGAVAALAGDVDLVVPGSICAGPRVVILADIRRVAIRAHEIPGLIDAGPVPGIAKGKFLARIKTEPALTSERRRTTVPRNPERLEAAAAHLDEVLLQRINAKRVFDFVVMKNAVRAVGAHHELRGALKEGRVDPVVAETRVVEVTQNGGICGRLHRQLMMRTAPQGSFGRVTACTVNGSHEPRAGSRSLFRCNDGANGFVQRSRHESDSDNHQNRDERQPSKDPRPTMRHWWRWGRSPSRRALANVSCLAWFSAGPSLPAQFFDSSAALGLPVMDP